MIKTKFTAKVLALSVVLALAACSGDDGRNGIDGVDGVDGVDGINGADGADGANGADGADGADGEDGVNGNSAVYTVQITNLTNAQPFSPVAIVLHEPGYHAFVDGEPASVALEELAEGGSNVSLMDDARSSINFLDVVSTSGPVPPKSVSAMQTLVVPELDADDLRLTVVTMLVNTNDAFTALNAVDVSNMEVGDIATFSAPTWDSGTEANTETAATIPGPAAQAAGGGGAAAGFDAARDDLFDVVYFHPGAVTSANAMDASAEGLSTSILSEGHRWDNPASRIKITRTR